MEEKYVLFGAGLTGMAILQYYGKDKIIAVIDNDAKKIETVYEDSIPIISIETYLKKYQDITIIISVYSQRYFECIEQLKMYEITNYFTSPPVIYGFETPEEFVENNKLSNCKHIVFYGDNPITERIKNYLKNSNVKIDYIDNGLCNHATRNHYVRIDDLKADDTLVLTTNESEIAVRNKVRDTFNGEIVDLYDYQEIRKEKYKYLEKYKDIYKGKRCFVIGNGPSLRKDDLMMLERNYEISFASNGIFHIYDDISWRPTYYVVCDAVVYKEYYKKIRNIKTDNVFIADYYYWNFKKIDHVNRFYLINKIFRNNVFEFSDDVVKGFYSGKTVTYIMLQLACYMGIKEIYLLGVDWTGGKNAGVPVKHFYKEDIECNAAPGMVIQHKYAYEAALKYANQHGIKIYNATRGGELEVFERVDFDTLF